jgi:hypothetical protein
MALPQADISYDRFHVIAMAIQAMDDVRREELRNAPEEVAAALLGAQPGTRRNLLWGMRKNPSGWTMAQTNAMVHVHGVRTLTVHPLAVLSAEWVEVRVASC